MSKFITSMTDFIEIKKSGKIKQIIRMSCPDGDVYIDWDITHTCINLRTNGRIFWLYSDHNITVNNEVVPNITLRQLITLLGYKNNNITIAWADSNCVRMDELIYLLPLCDIIIHSIVPLYSLFESGFKPFLEVMDKKN